jgi:hypothetical protein
MKALVSLLLAVAACGEPIAYDAGDPLPPACVGVSQAQSCPGVEREIVVCQRMEPVFGGGWVSSPVSGCLLTDMHGMSTADAYTAYCVERCP